MATKKTTSITIKLTPHWFVDGYYDEPEKVMACKLVQKEKYYNPKEAYLVQIGKAFGFRRDTEVFETKQEADKKYISEIARHIEYLQRSQKEEREELIVINDGVVESIYSDSNLEITVYDRCSDQDILTSHKASVRDIDIETNMQNLKTARFWWSILGDTPVDSNGNIEEPVTLMDADFKEGTDREEIWYWFEDTFDISLHSLLYPEK